MPLNASSLESESKEFAFADFNNVAFDRIHDQFQTVAQESANAAKHPFSGTESVYQNGKIIRIPSKPVISSLQFFVQRIKPDVGQQRR